MRSDVNSQCNGACGVCGIARNIYAYVKAWLDYGTDNDMHSNDSAAPPQVNNCFLPDAAALSNVNFGFDKVSWNSPQIVTILTFGMGSN